MPRPDQQPLLSTVNDNTETYTQQGSGLIRRYTIGQIRDHLQPSFGATVIAGNVVGQNIVLSLSNGGVVTIEDAVFQEKEMHIGSGEPSPSFGREFDSYMDKLTGNFYVKDSMGWQLQFNLASFISSVQVQFSNAGSSEPGAIGMYFGNTSGTHYMRSLVGNANGKVIVSGNSLGLALLDVDSDKVLQDSDTDQLPEGLLNLYFTDQRARHAISAQLPGLYNQSTGVFGVKISSDLDNVVVLGSDGGLKVSSVNFGDKHGFIQITNATTDWYFEHNLGKRVSIATYDLAGRKVCGDERILNLNNVAVFFNNPRTGYLVVN